MDKDKKEKCAGCDKCSHCMYDYCPCHQETIEPNFDPRMAIEVTIEDWEDILENLGLFYEDEGRYLIGMHGDSDCTRKVKELKDLIYTQKQLSRTSLIQELSKEMEELLIEMLKEEANTPLNKRKNGWDKILEIKPRVLTLLKSKLAEK